MTLRPVFIALATMCTTVVATSCNDWPVQATPGFRTLSVEVAANGLDSPVHVAAPAGDSRLFIVERSGTIRIVQGASVLTQPFLDVSNDVSTFGSERGMLSLAFHPRYAQNRRFFIAYTGIDGGIHVVQYRASASDANTADDASRGELLNIPTSGVQHYGGMMDFTPDGFLMIGIGEGGTFSEPGAEAQNPGSLLGKLLRVDVDGGAPYQIPNDNPFVGDANARPEIWAMGLRNPWRFSIDAATRQLYVADVGDVLYEEVNIVPVDAPALNYGWNYFEGSKCQFGLDFCASAQFHEPQVEYTHQPPCSSVTGGIVYRGAAYPEHQGRYFFADYCLGWIRSFRFTEGSISEELDWATSPVADHIVSFGEDGRGELYAVSLNGRVLRLGGERAR